MTTQATKIWTVWGISIGIYLGLNAYALFARTGSPGLPAMIGWGFAMPIFFIVMWWILAVLNRGELSKWWLLGFLSTAIFATAGILTVMKISAAWADV